MKWKGSLELDAKDLLCIAGVLAAILVVWFLLPPLHLWSWFLWLFDMRDWRWWAWTAAGAVSAGTFLAIVFWPERKQS